MIPKILQYSMMQLPRFWLLGLPEKAVIKGSKTLRWGGGVWREAQHLACQYQTQNTGKGDQWQEHVCPSQYSCMDMWSDELMQHCPPNPAPAQMSCRHPQSRQVLEFFCTADSYSAFLRLCRPPQLLTPQPHGGLPNMSLGVLSFEFHGGLSCLRTGSWDSWVPGHSPLSNQGGERRRTCSPLSCRRPLGVCSGAFQRITCAVSIIETEAQFLRRERK